MHRPYPLRRGGRLRFHRHCTEEIGGAAGTRAGSRGTG